ncbi:hypothetical protein BN1708_004725 [Verticillium longisporum]|uniref:Uncharacterized protein n=1 Tax=Verticillium longisporum TaxID=100787 RepID=A0A0G4M3A4_VERLO|nr:hypothetical protein BN1708_004725 [Verticillium longisporum]
MRVELPSQSHIFDNSHGPRIPTDQSGICFSGLNSRDTHKRTREAAVRLVPATLIRQDRGIEDRSNGLELLALERVEELQRRPADRQRQLDLALVGDRHGFDEGRVEVAVGVGRLGAHDEELALAVRVRRDVRREAGELVLVGWLEVDGGLGVVGEVGLASGYEGLLEPGADGLAADQRELSVICREDAICLRGSEPLQILVQALLKGVLLLSPVCRVVAGAGNFDVEGWYRTILHVQPVVVTPISLLDVRFTAKNTAAVLCCRSSAEVHKVRPLDELQISPGVDVLLWAHKPSGFGVKFLKSDAGKE